MSKPSPKSQGAHSKELDPGALNFEKAALFFVPLSIILVRGSLICILQKGFQYGVDFAGGTEVQVQFNQSIETSRLRKFTDDMGFPSAFLQAFEKGDEFLIRLEPIKASTEKEANRLLTETIQKITNGLSAAFTTEAPAVRRIDTVGPQVGAELKRNGILATFYSLLMILIYVGLRFDYKYAPGAVFCLFHDALVILGVYSVFGFEMNVQIMAAVLTIIGYSMNDTIVVFDRIRENEKVYRGQAFRWICNRSMNDVFKRTLLTSITTSFSVAVMYFLAGGVIKDFALTMGIGIVVGTYSSIYVATPLTILIDMLEHKKKPVPA